MYDEEQTLAELTPEEAHALGLQWANHHWHDTQGRELYWEWLASQGNEFMPLDAYDELGDDPGDPDGWIPPADINSPDWPDNCAQFSLIDGSLGGGQTREVDISRPDLYEGTGGDNPPPTQPTRGTTHTPR